MIAAIVMCCFPFDFYFFLIARFIYGLAVGVFCVAGPKYVSELAPTEMSGLLGGLSQFNCCFGILVPCLFALAIPDISTG